MGNLTFNFIRLFIISKRQQTQSSLLWLNCNQRTICKFVRHLYQRSNNLFTNRSGAHVG